MRRTALVPGLVTLALVVPITLALPVVTVPAATPHPVAPSVRHVALTGVDAPSLARAAATATTARVAVLTPERLTPAFRLIGVTWTGADPAGVQVRTRTAGVWSPWRTLGVQEDGPDAGTAEAAHVRRATVPLMVPGSDGYQVRVDDAPGRTPDQLRLELVDPGTSAADGAVAQVPAASASAGAAAPPIVTRAMWGADESLRDPTPRYTSTVKAGFVHHTVSPNSYWQSPSWTMADAAKDIRAIYAYSTGSAGYADLPYNFLVDQAGRVYEGRAGGVDKAVLGAATGGFNSDTMAVAALGDYETARPSSALIGGITRILAWKLGVFHVDPVGTTVLTSSGGGTSRYAAGVQVRVNTISGHRDVGATLCPGGFVYPYLPSIRLNALHYQAAALYTPALSSTIVVPDSGIPLTLTSRTPVAQTWRLDVSSPAGAVIRTFTGSTAANLVTVVWDGKATDGSVPPPGVYGLYLTSGFTGSNAVPWTGSVWVLGGGPPPTPPLDPVFWQSGVRYVGGRGYSTTCAPYNTWGTIRCFVSMQSYRWVQTSTGYSYVYAYRLLDQTFYDWVRPEWESDPRAVDGTWTSSAGLPMKTSCTFVAGTRTRTCWSYALTPVLTRLVSTSGRYYFTSVPTWLTSTLVYLEQRTA